MSLIKCPECGREISDEAASCPGCGCPVKSSYSDNDTILCKIDGVIDTIILYKNRIVIGKNNILSNRTMKGDREIFLHKINGVQVKHANMIISGFIHFSVNDGKSDVSLNEAIQDENTVMFRKSQNAQADKMKQMIIDLIK